MEPITEALMKGIGALSPVISVAPEGVTIPALGESMTFLTVCRFTAVFFVGSIQLQLGLKVPPSNQPLARPSPLTPPLPGTSMLMGAYPHPPPPMQQHTSLFTISWCLVSVESSLAHLPLPSLCPVPCAPIPIPPHAFPIGLRAQRSCRWACSGLAKSGGKLEVGNRTGRRPASVCSTRIPPPLDGEGLSLSHARIFPRLCFLFLPALPSASHGPIPSPTKVFFFLVFFPPFLGGFVFLCR